MRLRTFVLASTALLLAFACEKKKEEPAPQPVKPEIKIPAESQAAFSNGITFDSGSGEPVGSGDQKQSTTVKFTATETWSASVADTKASTWLSVQPTSGGAGTVTMTVTAQPNTSDKARSATVSIQCGTVKQSFTVNQDAAPQQTVAVESITLNVAELTLAPGASETLTATVAPEDATDKTVTWSTSDAEIATVADGKVTAVKEGGATITAKAGEKEATCKVTVKATVIAVESVTLNKTELALAPGASETLTVTVAPENATDKTVTWSTSNAEIATVADGKVTAVKEGEATITAKAGEKEATCKVTVKTDVIAVASVTLNESELTLEPGLSETLTATVTPENATDKIVTWSTSNAEIATVADGKVTAVKEGEAIITAKAGEKEATCKVTVKAAVIAVESVTLSKTELTLEPGGSETLTAAVLPENATDKTVIWSTSNAEIATVTDGKITAVKEGEAIITAKAGEKEATCKVTVKAAVIAVVSVTLNKTELTLESGVSETLTATVTPENATDKTVTWSTSNAEIVTVADGKVTAVKEGEAIITAKAGEKEATCKVTVKAAVIAVESVTLNKTELALAPGASETLTAAVLPENATDKTVTWSTSNSEIATVTNGKVTAVKEGEATITAKAGEKEATCKVTVKADVIAVETVTLDKTEVTLIEGGTEALTATVAPENATDKSITWSTSNAEVATVADGKVTAVKEGEAVITAKAGEKSATCKVIVKPEQFNVSGPVENLPAAGGTYTVKVSSNVSWTLKVEGAWISASVTSGDSGETDISIVAEKNASEEIRSAILTFTYGKDNRTLEHTIKQNGTVAVGDFVGIIDDWGDGGEGEFDKK